VDHHLAGCDGSWRDTACVSPPPSGVSTETATAEQKNDENFYLDAEIYYTIFN
jgi:hypothetical protein